MGVLRDNAVFLRRTFRWAPFESHRATKAASFRSSQAALQLGSTTGCRTSKGWSGWTVIPGRVGATATDAPISRFG